MATYEVNVKSYRRHACYEVGRTIRSMSSEQKQHTLNLIRDHVSKARVLGEPYDVAMLRRVVRELRTS